MHASYPRKQGKLVSSDTLHPVHQSQSNRLQMTTALS